ncbi:hypothetical protein KSP39_PZI022218 [Platanthera zijinensis]|uniref:Uncharacterized protein n=1 Tax=Platanthera zijinensis TaxID=2320716 RepID=A0AAP0AUS2_9ASPA
MPKGSKKRRAIKLRKETANNHSSSTNSSGPQGDDHDSSDHALTEEEFSPRAVLEVPPQHEPEPETAVSEEVSVIPVEHQTVSESEPIGAATAVTSEVLDEPSVPFKDEEKSAEVSLHRVETEVPESTYWAPVEQKIVSELEQTEAPLLAASEIFHKSFTPVEEKSGEVNIHHEQTEVLEAVSRLAVSGSYPLTIVDIAGGIVKNSTIRYVSELLTSYLDFLKLFIIAFFTFHLSFRR